jgi:hypothetical protein
MSKLFHTIIECKIMFDLLEKICSKENNKYKVDLSAYKKGNHHNFISAFLEECKKYYRKSKHCYITKATNSFKSFITILRQICNIVNVSYHSKIKYEKSCYEIVYYVSSSVTTNVNPTTTILEAHTLPDQPALIHTD